MTATTNGVGLLSALLAFQKDAPTIGLDSTNPAFKGSKYASLPEISKIVRPKLAEHGLVWTTMPSRDGDGHPTLRYKLAHATTGECLEGEMPLLLTKQDPQGLGSGLTYARRYSLLSVLGLAPDDDDDGNAGSGQATLAPAGTELAAAASTAVMEIAGGDRDAALDRWKAIKVAVGGGDLPKIVADALCAAAGTAGPIAA